MKNWKTTANGILTFLIATLTTITAFQIPSKMLNPQQSHLWLYVTLGANGLVALCRVWVGLLQNDAPGTAVLASAIANGGGVATPAQVTTMLEKPGATIVPIGGKGLALIAVLLPLMMLSGCTTVSTNPPTAPPITAPPITALNVLNEVQSDVLAVQNAELAAVNAGLIDAATNVKIQTALKQEALDATALATAISSAAAATTVQAKVDTLLADLQNDVTGGALGIKDAKTQATITAAIAVAEIAVNGIMTAYTAGK